jgi:asparagine synthase (glutamine-hydrolysing)
MSGFVGIVNLDGAPVDRALLDELTRSMDYRGPDARAIRILGGVGFGHTMLRTTWEAEREQQPCSLDGETWIAADCRVDAREDLIRELASHGRLAAREGTDPELILHAYALWGEDCVHHLLGDFAFAIWDGRNRRLFCARDHMGVKLFHYARKGNCLIFGNTLNTLRLHPAISDRLNDIAIGDFLLFGMNQDQSSTSFEDIRRLPPAHTLTCSGSDFRIAGYWTLPIDPPIRFRRAKDYTEHFLDLTRTVVKDRLRTDRVGVFMSGGLDSSCLAAIARESGAHVRAHTTVFDRLMPDRERYYAGAVAKHLGIPIDFEPADDYGWYEAYQRGTIASPDPVHVPVLGPEPRFSTLGAIARHSSIALFGEGPDNAMHYEWKPYLRHQLKQMHIGHLLRDIASFPFLFRDIPIRKTIVYAFRGRPNTSSSSHALPEWLNRDFAARVDLPKRFREIQLSRNLVHPVRPQGHGSFSLPLWQFIFEGHDPGVTGVPLEVRHPFVDIRMIRYLLALPVVPWCRDKFLMRRALRAHLPSEILLRPKTPLSLNPPFERSKETGVPGPFLAASVSEYIDLLSMAELKNDSLDSLWINLRPRTLSWFLRGVECCQRSVIKV